jgi:Flp pilus assembly protein TadD
MRESRHTAASHRLCVLVSSICIARLCGCAGMEQSPGVNAGSGSDKPQAESWIRHDQPPSARTLYSMADILATQGKDTDCEFVLRRCIREHPRFTPAYNSLAELQMRQGRVNEAIDVLSEALRVRPHDPVLLNNQGMCLLVHKQYGKALELFTSAAGVVPESQKYRANMATTLGLLGRHEESLALLQQVLPEDKAKSNAEILRRAYEKEASPVPGAQG